MATGTEHAGSAAAVAPELRLLLECARLEADPESAARLPALAEAVPDPERLVRLAVRHGLAPILHHRLASLRHAGVDDRAARLLREISAANVRRVLHLTGELLRILRRFDSHGVLAVPYKGPALAAQLYGNMALRQAGDLDVLVRRRDVRQARELLAADGFRPRFDLSDAAVEFMIRSRYSEVFLNGSIAVELHWAFTNRDVAFSLELEHLAPRLGEISLGGHAVRTMRPEDLLLILCVHGAKHRWDRLEWICGVDALVRTRGLAWSRVVAYATRLGVRRMLLLGVALAHELVRSPVPDSVLGLVRAEPVVARLAASVVRSVLAGGADAAGEGSVDLFRLRLRERPRDRLRYVWYRATTPGDATRWRAIRVSGWCVPLHGLGAPWFLLGRARAALRSARAVAAPPGGPARPEAAGRPLRILQVCQRPQRRGAEVFAQQLAETLRRQGHTVTTAYLYPYAGAGAIPLAAGDRCLDGDEGSRLDTVAGVNPRLLRRIRRLLAELRPDVIQVNGARTVKYGVLARRLLRDARGIVVYRNIGTSGDWLRGIRRRVFYRWIFRGLDGAVAISAASLAALRPVLARRTPATVISNAVDPAALRPVVPRPRLRASVATPPNTPVAVFVGSLSREKRVDRIVAAVRSARASVPDLHLWVVGDGPLRGELEALVRRAGLGAAVRFFGVRRDVASCIAAADFLVLASETEGVPGVILEAGYLGVPVVADAVGGVPECVTHEETGILVEPGNHRELVAALVRLSRDAELRADLGRRACRRIAGDHTMDVVAARFVDFYRAVLRAGGRAHGPGPAGDPPARERRRPYRIRAGA